VKFRDIEPTVCAVISRPARFVAWKTLSLTEKGTWRPFTVESNEEGDAKVVPYAELDGERWIYVFRRAFKDRDPDPRTPLTREVYEWVDELFVDEDGVIHATPMANARKTPRPAKDDMVVLGKRLSFARRIRGSARDHHFFASRVRLPLDLVDVLENGDKEKKLPPIAPTLPPVTFEPNADPHVIEDPEDEETLLVPVVDPITVALHLHAYFTAEAQGLVDYTSLHDGQSDSAKETVKKRQLKLVLSRLVKTIANNEEAKNADMNWPYRLEDPQQEELKAFLEDYDAEVRHRTRWRDIWAGFLFSWLEGAPMKLLEGAYAAKPKRFSEYLIAYCLCLTGASGSPEGRKHLETIVNDAHHFAHTYIFPQRMPPDKVIDVIKAGGSATFEALKEFAVPALAHKLKPEFFVVPMKVFSHFDVKIDLKGELQLSTMTETVHVKIFDVDKSAHRLEAKWEGAIGAVATLVEMVNFGITVATLVDTFGGDEADAEAKVMAVIATVSSAGNTTNAFLTVLGKAERHVAVVGFFLGAIDLAIAAKETFVAFKEGKVGAGIGSIVTGVGAYTAMVGSLLALTPMSAVAGPIGVLALGISFAGVAIKAIFDRQRDDLGDFLEHCVWGKNYGKAGRKVDWAETPFEQWDDNNYEAQLSALMQIICRFKIKETGSGMRFLMGWVPPGTVLHVGLYYWWDRDHALIRGEVTFPPGSARPRKSKNLRVSPNGYDGWHDLLINANQEDLIVENALRAAQARADMVGRPATSIDAFGYLRIKLLDTHYNVPFGGNLIKA
jgi:hypothetical protein